MYVFTFLVFISVLVQVALFTAIVLIDKQFWTHLYPFTFYVQVGNKKISNMFNSKFIMLKVKNEFIIYKVVEII